MRASAAEGHLFHSGRIRSPRAQVVTGGWRSRRDRSPREQSALRRESLHFPVPTHSMIGALSSVVRSWEGQPAPLRCGRLSVAREGKGGIAWSCQRLDDEARLTVSGARVTCWPWLVFHSPREGSHGIIELQDSGPCKERGIAAALNSTPVCNTGVPVIQCMAALGAAR